MIPANGRAHLSMRVVAAWLLFQGPFAHADVPQAPEAPQPPTVAQLTALQPKPPSTVMRPLWELGLGVGALRLPDYRGSDESRVRWFPVPYGVYRGKWLRADREGARAVLLDAQAVEVDLSVAASPPTRSRNNAARAGMPDLKAAIEFGPNISLTLLGSSEHRAKLDLRLPLRAALLRLRVGGDAATLRSTGATTTACTASTPPTPPRSAAPTGLAAATPAGRRWPRCRAASTEPGSVPSCGTTAWAVQSSPTARCCAATAP
jgi:MltA-interacting protein MipA